MHRIPSKLVLLSSVFFLALSCAGSRVAHTGPALHTGYAYAFLITRAEKVQDDNYFKARKIRVRARRHYVKAFEAGLAKLEKRHPGFRDSLEKNPGGAVQTAGKVDVPLLYWTSASLGAAISLSKDRPEMLIKMPQVGALAFRITELWPDYEQGAAYQLLMIYEAGRPAMMGGSVKLAKHYYAKAREIAGDNSPSLLVAYAESICVQEQDRIKFVAMLEDALALKARGPANRLAHKRARWLLGRVDELFL
ncbi:MAG: hypothetical protein KAU50_08065 [Candidatus Marinimicrobia bacterium]|nr:hypothetical protein [Candidatus Neomarinimicrobiota bacterium]